MQHSCSIDIPAPGKDGIIPAAYIGVDGHAYRVRTPVREILIEHLEGTLAGTRKAFDTWHGASWHLAGAKKYAPEGAYDKISFTVTWMNGFEYKGRFDLSRDAPAACLASHIRSHLTWLIDTRPSYVKPDAVETARHILEVLDIGQHRPAPAPKGWKVLRDFSAIPSHLGEPAFDRVIYGLENTPEANAEAPSIH